MEDKHIIALEIGSSKIKGAIGQVDESGILTVKAVEEQPLIDSVRHGHLNNIATAASTAKMILKKIENRISPRKVEGVYVSIGGRSLMSAPREVERKLLPETEITSELIEQLKRETLSTGYPGRDILEVEPREFIIDKKRVENPIGVYGSEITMVSNLIVCRPQLKRNLELLVTDKLSLRLEGYVVRQIAEAELVLTPEEKRLGCMLVDFGAETVTVSIYKYGTLSYLATIPIGSRNITRDITSLNYLEENAEIIKIQRGNARGNTGNSVEDVEFADMNNLVRHRAAEIIANIKEQLVYASLTPSELPSGIVIIGRGAKLAEFNTRLSETLKMSVRAGSALSPKVRIADGRITSDSVDIISILYGATLIGAKECLSPEIKNEFEDVDPDPDDDFDPEPPRSGGGFFSRLGNKLKTILEEPAEDDEELYDDEEN